MKVNSGEVWDKLSGELRRFIAGRVPNEHDAEDILQDVFCKVHERLDSLRDEGKLRTWLYQIARNAVTDYYRRRRDMAELREDMAEEPLADDDISGELTPCIRGIIDRLPEKYRQAILLTEYEGLSQREMGERLGLSPFGARARVQRARRRLRAMLLQCCRLEFDPLGRVLYFQPREDTCPYCDNRASLSRYTHV